MIRNNSFLLRKIEDRYFLLPTGQDIIAGKRAYEINELGLLIWNLLAEDLSKEEIVGKVTDMTDLQGISKEEVTSDIYSFIDRLTAKGVIRYTPRHINKTGYDTYRIGGFYLKIYDKGNVLANSLKLFMADEENKDDDNAIKVYIDENHMPFINVGGNPLVRTEELVLCENEECFHIEMKKCPSINEVSFVKKAKSIYININSDGEEAANQILQAIRIAYLYYALEADCIMLHSASVLYRGKLWLFSAPSGTGKSTHAAMWERYSDAEIINGDTNLISLDGEKMKVKGTPWCGTSERFDSGEYELGGIIILERGKEPKISEMDMVDKILSVTRRVLSPTWNKEMMSLEVSGVEKVCKAIPVFKLSCNMDKESFDISREYIDSLIE